MVLFFKYYITLNNLSTREKSNEFFLGSTCGSGFGKKNFFFSVRKPTGKIAALTELLRVWEDLFISYSGAVD